jgi:hypothetical protein
MTKYHFEQNFSNKPRFGHYRLGIGGGGPPGGLPAGKAGGGPDGGLLGRGGGGARLGTGGSLVGVPGAVLPPL